MSLDPDARSGSFSDELQGNVLRGYDYDHARFAFFAFEDAAFARGWLKAIRASHGGTWDRPEDGAQTVALSYRGLQQLGVDSDILSQFPNDFRAGMRARSANLLDSDRLWTQESLDPVFRSDEISVLVSLFGDDASKLEARASALAAGKGVAYLGAHPANRLQDRREHFGFRDGISQPVRKDGEGGWTSDVAISKFLLFESNWNAGETADPALGLELGRLGTFLVYRKLEQDVVSFREFLQRWTVEPAYLAAKIVGRWPNGTPVGRTRPSDEELSRDDDSNPNFEGDPSGEGCPLGAHVRRVNPQNARISEHRILRRGVPYGPPLALMDSHNAPVPEPDGQSRGLIFICLNASIEAQFEFIQRAWINQHRAAGLDEAGIIAHTLDEPVPFDLPGKGVQDLDPVVRLLGGEYFFMPSMRALDGLGNGKFGS